MKKIRENFQVMSALKLQSLDITQEIHQYIERLEEMYSQLLQSKTNDRMILYFGLNTFHFQIRFFKHQLEDCKREFIFMNNHIYADYYKLYQLIMYNLDAGSDETLKQKLNARGPNFPTYLDLEPFKSYTEEELTLLHNSLCEIITAIDERNGQIKSGNSFSSLAKNLDGIPIGNLLHGLEHESKQVGENVILYVHYSDFFQDLNDRKSRNHCEQMSELIEKR